MKSEPDVFSIDDLKREKTSLWDGVRNYQARNFMMNEMNEGDQVLFYHSNAKPPGIAGLATISKNAVPDPTQFDAQSKYFDEKSNLEKPRWFCVEVQFLKKFSKLMSLDDIRSYKSLKDMMVIQKGSRLSIQPVLKKDFDFIVKKLS